MRHALLLILTAFVLGVGVASAQESGVDVFAPAAYTPDDVGVYVAVRTDDAYFETLDTLSARVIEALPPLMRAVVPEDFSLSETVFGALSSLGTFEDVFRPWVGDWVSIGLYPEQSGAAVIALETADRAAAIEFVETRLLPAMGGGISGVEASGFTVYDLTLDGGMPTVFAVGDEVTYMIGVVSSDLILGSDFAPLSERADFIDAAALLPEDAYNIAAYFNTFSVRAALLTGSNLTWEAAGMLRLLQESYRAGVVGLTIVDDATLIADIGLAATEAGARGANPPDLDVPPVSAAFAERIPENAALVSWGRDTSAAVDQLLPLVQPFSRTTTVSFPDQVEGVLQAFENTTGIDFEDTLVRAFRGDYAAFLSYEPPGAGEPAFLSASIYPDETIPLNIGGGFVLEVSDEAAATDVLEAFDALLQRNAGDALANVAPVEIDGVTGTIYTFEVPGVALAEPLELVLAHDGAVFVAATRAEADAILSGEPGLASAPGYGEAIAYFLDVPYSVAYMNEDGLNLLLDTTLTISILLAPAIENIFNEIVTELDPDAVLPPTPDPEALRRQQIQQLAGAQIVTQGVAGLVSTSSITLQAVPDTGLAISAALTLNLD